MDGSSGEPAAPGPVVDRRAITTPVRADRGSSGFAAGDVYALGAVAGESPVWLASRGIVASVDAVGGTVHLLHLEDAVDEVVALREQRRRAWR